MVRRTEQRPDAPATVLLASHQREAVIMIMISNSQETFQTCGLHPETVLHLQRLVLLNIDSRDAYRASAILAKDTRLVTLAEHTALERQNWAVTLQNILWSDGNESTSQICINTSGNHGILNRIRESPETSAASIIQRLLDIDDYVYSCYGKVIGTIKGRGIRQLLSEHASRTAELRTTLTGLQSSLDTPSENIA